MLHDTRKNTISTPPAVLRASLIKQQTLKILPGHVPDQNKSRNLNLQVWGCCTSHRLGLMPNKTCCTLGKRGRLAEQEKGIGRLRRHKSWSLANCGEFGNCQIKSAFHWMWRKVRWRVTTVYSALLHILKTRSYFIVSTYATTQRPVLLLFQQSSEIWIVYSYFGPFHSTSPLNFFCTKALRICCVASQILVCQPKQSFKTVI